MASAKGDLKAAAASLAGSPLLAGAARQRGGRETIGGYEQSLLRHDGHPAQRRRPRAELQDCGGRRGRSVARHGLVCVAARPGGAGAWAWRDGCNRQNRGRYSQRAVSGRRTGASVGGLRPASLRAARTRSCRPAASSRRTRRNRRSCGRPSCRRRCRRSRCETACRNAWPRRPSSDRATSPSPPPA